MWDISKYVLVKNTLDELRISNRQGQNRFCMKMTSNVMVDLIETLEWSTKENLLEANAEPIWT